MARSKLADRLVLAPRGLIDLLCPYLGPKSGSPLLQSRHFHLRHPPLILSSHLHTSESLPRVTQPSVWTSLVPKFLRPSQSQKTSTPIRPKSKEWNPATFFIVIFMLIGSQSIQMIALRNESTTFSRRADARIELLKETIERVQAGEDVDVTTLLGTGDKAQEKEWEEVMQEIAKENALWQENKKKLSRQQQSNEAVDTDDVQTQKPTAEKTPNASKAPRGFY